MNDYPPFKRNLDIPPQEKHLCGPFDWNHAFVWESLDDYGESKPKGWYYVHCLNCSKVSSIEYLTGDEIWLA